MSLAESWGCRLRDSSPTPTLFAPSKPRDVTTESGSVCALCVSVRFANHLGSILRGWNHDRSGTSWGSWSLPVSPPFLRSSSPPPHRSLSTNVSRVEGRRFSAPGGRGPSLEACRAPSRGPELIATCTPRPSPSSPNSPPQAVILLARRRTGAGVQEGCVTFQRTPPRPGSWWWWWGGWWRLPRGLQAVYRSPSLGQRKFSQYKPLPPFCAFPASQASNA